MASWKAFPMRATIPLCLAVLLIGFDQTAQAAQCEPRATVSGPEHGLLHIQNQPVNYCGEPVTILSTNSITDANGNVVWGDSPSTPPGICWTPPSCEEPQDIDVSCWAPGQYT